MLQEEMDCWIDELEDCSDTDLASIMKAVSAVQLMRKTTKYSHWSEMPWADRMGYTPRISVEEIVPFDWGRMYTKVEEEMDCCEPMNADWEHQVETTETTWTIQNYMQYNSDTNNLTVNTVCQPPATRDEFMNDLTCFGRAQLGNLVCPPVLPTKKSYNKNPGYQAPIYIEKEQDMYNEVQEAKRHLEIRADSILRTRNEEIAKVTNLNPPKPKTGAELKQWLKDGNYSVDIKDDRKIDPWCDPSGYVRLGPAFDEEKYNALQEQLKKDKTVVKDAIYILPPADALKALQEFEAKTYN